MTSEALWQSPKAIDNKIVRSGWEPAKMGRSLVSWSLTVLGGHIIALPRTPQIPPTAEICVDTQSDPKTIISLPYGGAVQLLKGIGVICVICGCIFKSHTTSAVDGISESRAWSK